MNGKSAQQDQELFYIATDPNEKINLASQQSDIYSALLDISEKITKDKKYLIATPLSILDILTDEEIKELRSFGYW